jgi:hypothetical protein
MSVDRRVIHWVDNFDRAQTLTTTPGQNGWTKKATASAGTPTIATVSGGGLVLTLAATSEAEVLTAYQNDILPFPLKQVKRVSWNAKVTGVDNVTTLVMGLSSAENDTPDSATLSAWFKLAGATSLTNVVVETDDNVIDNNNIATAVTLGSTFKRFEIDFTGGLSDVRFFIDGQPVALATTFSMPTIVSTDKVQPLFQLAKASGTGVPSLTIRDFHLEYVTAVGA